MLGILNAEVVTAIATSIVAASTVIIGVRYLIIQFNYRRACRNHPNESEYPNSRPSELWLKREGYYIESSIMPAAEFGSLPKSNHVSFDIYCIRCDKQVGSGYYTEAV